MTSAAPRFCGSCSGVVSLVTAYLAGKGDPPPPDQHRYPLRLENGCDFCQWILPRLGRCSSSIDLFTDPQCCYSVSASTPNRLERSAGRGLTLMFFGAHVASKHTLNIEPSISCFTPIHYKDHRIPGRNIFLDPLEATSFLANHWITECVRHHPECAQIVNAPLPSRVLEIGWQLDSPILLRETSDSTALPGYYTILSHCWGTKPTLITTSKTIANHKAGIAFDALPKTFQDAVRVTRALGFKYLWIDTLCIIQGDDETSKSDWNVESSKMLEYYRNAHVTIGAMFAEDTHAGFLGSRAETTVQIADNLYLREKLGPNNVVSKDYSTSVLERRAWCLQERFASTRVLQYGASELFWECHTNSRRERDVVVDSSLPDGFSMRGVTNMIKYHIKRTLPRSIAKAEVMNVWYQLVQSYSQRALTRQTDALPAIASIARIIQERTGNTYVHGLWAEDIVKGLRWHRFLKGKPNERATGAPSWSWASTDARIVYVGNPVTSHHSAIKLLRTPTTYDREIFIRGRCREVTLDRGYPKERTYVPKNSMSCWDLKRKLNRSHPIVVRNILDRRLLGHASLDTSSSFAQGKKICTALELIHDQSSQKGPLPLIYFLILVHNKRAATWRRIGFGIAIYERDKVAPYRLMFDDCKYENICLI